MPAVPRPYLQATPSPPEALLGPWGPLHLGTAERRPCHLQQFPVDSAACSPIAPKSAVDRTLLLVPDPCEPGSLGVLALAGLTQHLCSQLSFSME